MAAANPATPCHSPRAVRPRFRASCGTTGDGPARANPIWNTTQVSRITPPKRTVPASGPSAWPIGSVASGTPPNGNTNRSASASVCAAGLPITRHGPVGAQSAATGVEAGEDRRGSDVAGWSQRPHPCHSGKQPRRGEQPSSCGTSPGRRQCAERHLEHGDAEKRERPDPPRWQRQRHTEPADEGQRSRARKAWDSNRHQRATIVVEAIEQAVTRWGRVRGARRCVASWSQRDDTRTESPCSRRSGRRSTARRGTRPRCR